MQQTPQANGDKIERKRIIRKPDTLNEKTILEAKQSYNPNNQVSQLQFTFSQQLAFAVYSDEWTWFTKFDALKDLKSSVPSEKKKVLRPNHKIAMLLTEDALYVDEIDGTGTFSPPTTCSSKLDFRMQRIFNSFTVYSQKEKRDTISFNAQKYGRESVVYQNAAAASFVFVHALLKKVQLASDAEVTSLYANHRIANIETVCYLALKTAHDRLLKAKDVMVKGQGDILLETYKITYYQSALTHAAIAKFTMGSFDLGAYKWYNFKHVEQTNKIIIQSHYAIYRFSDEGLVSDIINPGGIYLPIRNRDSIVSVNYVSIKYKEITIPDGDKIENTDVIFDLESIPADIRNKVLDLVE